MNIDLIRKKLTSEEYDFLRSDTRLGKNIILLTLGGSYAYGTNIDTLEHVSDIDIRGIRLNSKEEILTMNLDDKPYEDKELDVVIYPLKQIITLLTKSNPNTLEILGTKEEHILHITEEGKIIRDNVELFLSKSVYKSFGGYASSQLKRLENALARENNKKDELHLLKHAMHLIRLLIMGSEILSGEGVNTYRDKDKGLLLDIRNGKYTYEEIFKIAKDYEKKFEYAYVKTTLPDEPNFNKINELIIEINKKVLSR